MLAVVVAFQGLKMCFLGAFSGAFAVVFLGMLLFLVCCSRFRYFSPCELRSRVDSLSLVDVWGMSAGVELFFSYFLSIDRAGSYTLFTKV